MRTRSTRPRDVFNKITIFIVASGFITFIIVARLFQLQVLAHDKYQTIANQAQYGYTELPAQRGEIIIKDYHSNDEFPLATNTTLNLLYADPTIIEDSRYVASIIYPLIFDIELERAKDNERVEEMAKVLDPELTEEEVEKLLKPLSDDELEDQFRQELTDEISSKQRQEILLATEMEDEILNAVRALGLSGIEVIEDAIYAYPPMISNTNATASALAPIIEMPSKRLNTVLKGLNRYVVLKRKLQPEISRKIEEIMRDDKDDRLNGLAMKEEYFRYYPETTLAANIVGYVNHANIGQYGIESAFNRQLQGKIGKLQTKQDSLGRQITVGESDLSAAEDGDDIVLTIDRSIQLQTDKILEAALKEYRADSGQIIVMNPQTGAIIAMSHYPSFDPNNYGKVFSKVEIELTEEEVENLYPTREEGVYDFYVNAITLDKYPVFEEIDEEGRKSYFRYENFRGPEVYHNKIVSWPYEPGSVFKTVAMAAGIDDGDVTPNTTFNDVGPIGVDFNVYKQDFDFEIKNSENKYMGLVNMKVVLAHSLNTGMTFLSKKMGSALFYSYLKKFGFLDRTDIEFDGEAVGRIEYFEDWTESELATHTFGQGITVTMLQMINAYNTIANGGILMQPYVVDEVRHDNKTITKTEPHEIRRVISEDTASKMASMLAYSVTDGVAKNGGVVGHQVAGKTGTSQTYKHGKALSGTGTTITSFAGFGPINDPQFVILVKFDHPRLSEWGSATAAPTFSKLATYLFDYYNIPPDK
jgi:cell division protein FtsI/penicillin-binding protein 2